MSDSYGVLADDANPGLSNPVLNVGNILQNFLTPIATAYRDVKVAKIQAGSAAVANRPPNQYRTNNPPAETKNSPNSNNGGGVYADTIAGAQKAAAGIFSGVSSSVLGAIAFIVVVITLTALTLRK